MDSATIQTAVYNTVLNMKFNAPYGVLESAQVDSKGKKYKSVTFGYSIGRDFEVRIYNRNFMILRDSYRSTLSFKNHDDLIQHLQTL
jgi:hypothetical protein